MTRNAILVAVFLLGGCDGTLSASSTYDAPPAADAGSAGDVRSSADAGTVDAYVPSSTHELIGVELLAADNAGLDGDVTGVVGDGTVELDVPAGTDVTALVPTLTIDGASVSPASGEPTSFEAPVTYTVSAEDGSSASWEVTVHVAVDCTPTAPVCDRRVYDDARSYAAANPTRDGGSWSGWCAALMVRFGGYSRYAPSAISAYGMSSIVGHDPSAAPVGAYHWWDIGRYGHVGIDLLGGGTTVFMASSHLADSWGTAIGVNSVPGYNAASGARYLGWSTDYIGQHQPGGGGAACTTPTLPEGCPVPSSNTATSGSPDAWFWMRLQMYAALNGYTGPIDGVLGVQSWAGVQRGMRDYGYTGPDDGVPGVHTYAAMQRLAAAHGYTGPVDGVLGPNSYRGIARYLNTL